MILLRWSGQRWQIVGGREVRALVCAASCARVAVGGVGVRLYASIVGWREGSSFWAPLASATRPVTLFRAFFFGKNTFSFFSEPFYPFLSSYFDIVRILPL